MASVRSTADRKREEDIRREMKFVNTRAVRAEASTVHAARDDKVKRHTTPSLSSSFALELHERAEVIKNDTAIAAVIAKEIEQAEDNPDWESNSRTSTTLTKPMPIVTLSVPAWFVTNYNILGLDELPIPLQYIVLAYADYLPVEKVRYQYPTTIGTTFFTRYVSQIQYGLEQAANDLLNKGKIDIALALVRANGREVLNVPTCGRDRFGTCVKGTLLQMAGMAGDVNLREKKPEEKEHHGALELLAQAGGFTNDEVADQLLPVLFSKAATDINEARKNSVLNIFIEFAENILERKKDLPVRCLTLAEFKEAQAKCQPEINRLRNTLLEMVSNKTVTSGYILDSQIFVDLIQWFEKPENLNPTRFGDWWSTVSDLFWVNGYGSLQYVAAARDAQVCKTGIGRIVDDKELPARTLDNPDGSSHFLPYSKLGDDFFFAHYGRGGGADGEAPWRRQGFPRTLGNLMASKNNSIAKFYEMPKQSSTKNEEHVRSEEHVHSNVKRC